MKILRKVLKPSALVPLFLFFGIIVQAQQPQKGWVQKFESPKAFIENRGQFYVREGFGENNSVLYGYDASETRIFFRKDGVTFNFTRKSKEKEDEDWKNKRFRNEKEFQEEMANEHKARLQTDEVAYNWEGANPDVKIIPSGRVESYFNYSFNAGGKEKNEYYIPGYSKLLYQDIYPNIDIEYSFHPEQGIKYVIILHPGADITKVKMSYSKKPRLDENGNLLIPSDFGTITDHAPVSFYQANPSASIFSRFRCDGKSASFILGEYDNRQTVVIDPWTATPSLPNSNKVWECETSSAGDVFAYGGDTFIKLIKYNSTGTVQWTYTSPWDSANYWIGGFITHPNGESYMTSGSNGEIRKISTTGTVSWSNNPNGLTSYEYWSLAFNCDLTKLVVGGTRVQFSIPFPVIRGVVININLGTGAQSGVTVVGYGSAQNIPPNIQEVSSICFAPNNNFYFLTLDTIGSINNALSTVNFKAGTGYAFDYYIPGYGFGTKQPISAIRASTSGVYTLNGATVHKRSLANGSVQATAAIPSGSYTPTFLGRNVNGNGGLDIDNSGNVFVGSVNTVVKYDANLNQLTSAATSFAVYDVDVNANGEVIACGFSGGTGYVQSLGSLSPAAQMAYVCSSSSPLSVTSSQTNITCFGSCNGSAAVNVSGGTPSYTYSWAPSGGNAATATGLCSGTYTCTITDNVGATTTATFNITQPGALSVTAVSQTNISCNGGSNGAASVSVSGGTSGYSYNWTPGNPTGDGTASVSGLASGTYSCTVTDANGCTATQTFSITQPSALAATGSSTNVSCNGGTNGTASVNASGGAGGYTYSWAPSGGNASSASGLGSGTYTCTITDANGCTTTQNFTITQPSAVTASIASTTDASCNSSNGSATVNAGGGAGSYTYSWAPSGGNAATANNLAAGTYTCTVTDASGCTATVTANINNIGGPSVSVASQQDVSCFGGNNGNASVNATGSGTLTYSWSPSGGNASSASNLSAGTYTVSVTDGNGCTTTQVITITSPAQLTASTSVVAASCGNNNGSASVSPAGGAGSYTYAWAPSGGNGATESNLAVGTYTVTVTDANGCTATATAAVGSSGGPTVTVSAQQDVSCFGGNNGSATVNATGSAPFTYSWSPSGGNAATATGLSMGTYMVTVTDSAGCATVQTVTITEPPQLSATGSSTAASCGNNNGSATVSATGGTGSYTYLWSNSQTSQTISNIAGGNYSVTITDANGCTTVTSVNVANTGAPTVALQSSSDITCFGANDGTATVTASGGSSPYTYSWSPSGGNAATASNLAAGTYTVTVTGSDGCSQTQTVTITQPAAIQVNSTTQDETCGNGDGTALAAASGGDGGPYTYSWSNGGNTAAVNNLSAGSYTVTVTDGSGCTTSSTVAIANTGSATADAGLTVTIQQGQSTMLTGSGGATYSWSPGTGLSCTSCQNPIASPTVTTTYTLTVTDSLGCTDADTVTVIVDIACGDIYVPNAFSPNGDGSNEVLYVRGNCIEFLQFQVYNRWGEKVFETSDPTLGWDGSWRGEPCASAVFTYVLRATLLDGTQIEDEGSVSLVK